MDKPSTRATRRRALLALFGAGLGLSAALRAAAQNPSPPVQGLRRLQGEVRINGVPAGLGTVIRGGDSVRTGRGALAVFSVGQDAFLMRDNSSVELTGRDVALEGLRLVTGKLLGVFAAGGIRRLRTPTATIGIRGTGGYLEAERRRTYFCLCYGSAQIAAAGGGARDAYSTTHHESPRYIYGDRRTNAIVPATVVNHTDDELILLEALLGRTPPPDFMARANRY